MCRDQPWLRGDLWGLKAAHRHKDHRLELQTQIKEQCKEMGRRQL